MSASDNEHDLVAENLYQQSYADLVALRSSLPDKAVVSLAREVLRRMAERSVDAAVPADSIDMLTTSLIGPRPDHAAELVEEQYRRGADVETLYLGYLAPAARTLGEWWESDRITFADVTVGTGRIYAIMRSLQNRFVSGKLPEGKTAFFASVPLETHTLGIKMAADLCREQGWRIDLEMGLDHETLVERIVASDHLLVGLSAGGLHALPALARLILAVRVSRPGVRILVSGHIVDEAEDSIRLMHVDGMSRDFKGAIALLETHWQELHGSESAKSSGQR